jgi:DNA-binding MarR family transcriptional regulator
MKRRPVTAGDYETLAAFRHALARFLGFSEAAAEAAGLTPRQYQALLAMRAHPGPMNIGELAERLQIHHHSAVGLVDRLEALGLARRIADRGDRRRVHVASTAKGQVQVARLAAIHRDELQQVGEGLRALLDRLSLSGSGAEPRARGARTRRRPPGRSASGGTRTRRAR